MDITNEDLYAAQVVILAAMLKKQKEDRGISTTEYPLRDAARLLKNSLARAKEAVRLEGIG
ncbi:MAG TPA: hypothetical protein VHO70_19845 [Chitinispirillaceae bacterium]|nr:hypothetical protein [Chitinispirillaceae bacterium]